MRIFSYCFLASIFGAALGFGLLAVSPAKASPIQVDREGGSVASTFVTGDDWLVEGRIGGRTTWELGLGSNTHNPSLFDETHFTWQSGQSVAFNLIWDGTEAAMTLGNKSVEWTTDGDAFNALQLRLWSRQADGKLPAGMTSRMSNLVINGTTVTDELTTLTGATATQDSLVLFRETAFDQVMLSGNIELDWDGLGTNPWQRNAQSRWTFTIKSGDVTVPISIDNSNDSSAVPAPASLALFALAGAALIARRRSD